MSTLSYEETELRSGVTPRRSGRVRWIKGIGWTSVFAGVVVALGVQALLSMLGTGVGMSTIDPLRVNDTPSAAAFSIGAGLWWVVSSFIALVAGGWVAAQFSGYLRHVDGILHGMLVWALTTLITIYLLGSAIGSAMTGAGNVLSAGARGMAESAAVVSWDDIKQDARTVLSQQVTPQQRIDPVTGMYIPVRPRPAVMDPEFNLALERFLTADNASTKEDNRTVLINLLAARTGMSIDEATNRVNSWERTYQQAELKAREAADRTAKAISWAAMWGFLVILVSAIAAALGGLVGTPLPDSKYQTKNVEIREEL